jgi:subtilisin family serine protease
MRSVNGLNILLTKATVVALTFGLITISAERVAASTVQQTENEIHNDVSNSWSRRNQIDPTKPFSKTLGADVDGAQRVGTYIVRTRNAGSNSIVLGKASNRGIKTTHKFNSTLNGFAARLSKSQVHELRRDSNVLSVTLDKRARAFGTQESAPWHLDRLDRERRDYKYSFSSAGDGVTIYVVDTGVRTDHSEFSGRIPRGYNAITNATTSYDDCNGHGTHVAGLAAGTNYGVAKMAWIVPVKVLDCAGYGSVSDIIRGLDWIEADVIANGKPAVVNLSLGVEADNTLDTAVQSLITAGITVVAAAGNESANACAG